MVTILKGKLLVILKRNKGTNLATKSWKNLKAKYKDEEIIDSIMRKYNEKMKRVKKLAEKIRERLHAKHPNLSHEGIYRKSHPIQKEIRLSMMLK